MVPFKKIEYGVYGDLIIGRRWGINSWSSTRIIVFLTTPYGFGASFRLCIDGRVGLNLKRGPLTLPYFCGLGLGFTVCGNQPYIAHNHSDCCFIGFLSFVSSPGGILPLSSAPATPTPGL